jgi:hypothetical protein
MNNESPKTINKRKLRLYVIRSIFILVFINLSDFYFKNENFCTVKLFIT